MKRSGLCWLLLCSAVQTEDGYEAWLRYRPAPDALLLDYRDAFGGCVQIRPSSQSFEAELLESARAELARGLAAILAAPVPVAVCSACPSQGCAVLSVEPALQSSLGSEGYQVARTGPLGPWAPRGRLQARAATASGLLHGTFDLLQRLTRSEPLPSPGWNETQVPALGLRIWDLWDNLDGSIERGYAGRSLLWPMALSNWTAAAAERVNDMARLLKSVGLNGLVINNVNACGANTALLEPGALKRLADTVYPILSRWGIKLFITPCYAAPMSPHMGLPQLSGVDPLDPKVIQWWERKASAIVSLMPRFGGFLVKADAEGNQGPLGYNRTEADGANLLARALGPARIVMWRAFVYGNGKIGAEDRARQAADTFGSLDGQFDSNVVVQIKNGPIDFQVREPISPLLTGLLPNTNVMMEVQAAQEYTGQAVHAVGLTSQWVHYLGFDTLRLGPNSTVANLLARRGPFKARNSSLTGLAAVSNLGDNNNWTGSVLAQSNTYGFGRLAWEPTASSKAIHRDWARQSFGLQQVSRSLDALVGLMEDTWPVYENYTSPLGIGFVVSGGYGGGPCMGQPAYDSAKPYCHHNTSCGEGGCPKDRWPAYLELHGSHYWMDPCSNWGYANYSIRGVGCDRSSRGSGYSTQYAAEWTERFDDPATCPEELLLFFHNLPWSHKLTSGLTIIEHFDAASQAGVEAAGRLQAVWNNLTGIDPQLQRSISDRFALQIGDASFFRETLMPYWQGCAGGTGPYNVQGSCKY